MRTAIVTDSNCGIPAEEAASMGVFVVPMPVVLGDTVLEEGVTLTSGELIRRLNSGERAKTSQPAPAAVTAVWDRVFREGYEELVYLPMSSGLSGCCQTARAIGAWYPKPVFVADVRRISVTQRQAVEDAVRLRQSGMGAWEIRTQLEQNADKSVILVAVDDLSYLKRGGRITPAAAAMASVLNVKPLLIIRGKMIDSFEKVRGQKQCRKRLRESMQSFTGEYRQNGYALHVGVAGSFLCDEDAAAWLEMAQEAFPDEDVRYDPLTASISCHTGPNAFGMGISVRPADLTV